MPRDARDDIDCTYGADVVQGFVHRWWIYSNGALTRSYYLPANSNASALPKYVSLMTRETFGYHVDVMTGYFKAVYNAVISDRSQAIRERAPNDPVGQAGLAVQNLHDLLGGASRGVVWGLSALGAAVAVAVATATPIGWLGCAAVFLAGFDAGLWNDVVTDWVGPAPQTLGGGGGDDTGVSDSGDTGGGTVHCVTMVKTDGTTETRCGN